MHTEGPASYALEACLSIRSIRVGRVRPGERRIRLVGPTPPLSWLQNNSARPSWYTRVRNPLRARPATAHGTMLWEVIRSLVLTSFSLVVVVGKFRTDDIEPWSAKAVLAEMFPDASPSITGSCTLDFEN